MNFLHVSRFKSDQILESSATASACFKNHVGCTIQPWWYARTVTKFDLEHIERLCTSVETTCSQNVLSEQNQEKMNIYTSDVKAGLLKYKGSCWTHLFWWTLLPFFGYWIYYRWTQVCCSHVVGKTLDSFVPHHLPSSFVVCFLVFEVPHLLQFKVCFNIVSLWSWSSTFNV